MNRTRDAARSQPDSDPRQEQKIFRINARRGYTRLSNRMLSDSRLTFEARGMLAYLLSKPAGWEVRISDLIRASPDSATKIRRVLHELMSFGYVKMTCVRGDNGKFGSTYQVYEDPEMAHPDAPEAVATDAENPHPCGSTESGEPSRVFRVGSTESENLHLYKENEVPMTDSEKNERERSTPTEDSYMPDADCLPDARAEDAPPANTVWDVAQAELRRRIARGDYERVIAPLTWVKQQNGVTVLRAPSKEAKRLAEDKYHQLIARAIGGQIQLIL